MANTYRIRKLAPTSGNAAPDAVASYEPQFSQDDGTTWTPLSQIPTLALVEAEGMLRNVINGEASFNAQVAAGKRVPVQTFSTFPPA